jgi:hypothetical protein
MMGTSVVGSTFVQESEARDTQMKLIKGEVRPKGFRWVNVP